MFWFICDCKTVLGELIEQASYHELIDSSLELIIFIGMDLPQAIEDKELGRLAMHVDDDKKIPLQAHLNLDFNTRQRLERENSGNIQKEIFYSLNKWKKCSRTQPTFRALGDILNKCGINCHVLCKVCQCTIIPHIWQWTSTVMNIYY